MPFIVTTTHTIPDDAPVTADMLSDVLRPSRWAGLPVGTATTARVDFVAARPVAPKPAEAGQSFDEAIVRMAARAVGLNEDGPVNPVKFKTLTGAIITITGDASSCAVTIETDQPPASFRHPRDPVRSFGG